MAKYQIVYVVRLILISLLASSLIACSSLQTRSDVEGETAEVPTQDDVIGEVADTQGVPADAPTSTNIKEISYSNNKYVQMWVNYFQGRGRKHMEVYLERSGKYIEMMKAVLKEEGLPEDLIYIALIESGFSAQAHSHASAVGYWQFIRGTGSRYGLRIDGFVDERRDPVLSTHAAAQYFKSLYSLFGDWYLSMAAYNAGENRIKRAAMKYNTRNFWDFMARRRLPKETQNYVPKYLAARLIAQNPSAYGFHAINYKDQLEYDVVEVSSPISLTILAKEISMPYDELKVLNPMYRTDFVPVYRGVNSTVRVPKGMLTQAYAALPKTGATQPTYVSKDYFIYRVRPGDNLSTIARRHRTGVATLRNLNYLSSRSVLRIGQRLRVPETSPRLVQEPKTQKNSGQRGPSGVRTVKPAVKPSGVHIVKRGENLTMIAEELGVSVQQLKAANKMKAGQVLFVGKKLKVPGSESAEQVSKSSVAKTSLAKVTPKTHKVRNGENLTLIAKKYGVSVQKLKQLNGFSSRSVLKRGQKIVVASNSK
jgi:membrane-bound lytic murein transglycosylase D